MSSLTTRTIKSGDKALLTVITLMEEKALRKAGLKAMHDLALEPWSIRKKIFFRVAKQV